ncbi:hypothetical protein B0H66DRAFT_581844 [Apodospora peruviana]|uniref:WSC domain-containing protein n=1 Tax=Apodospora peruviana TaxID=516989 RepID=A0AAE0IDG1_9PEZI|nr:hypothetical protein B0H66DRAFT_581844 [Apodospora peruviana]
MRVHSFWGVASALLSALLPLGVSALASTDSFRDADAPQSGYLANHNLDPNIVGSASFKTLWTFTSPDSKELFLAKPLIYTPNGGPELVITSSEKNIVRVFDSKTGTILNQRVLQPPFASADSNCGDIPTWIGITGTPIIDTNTDTIYLFSKGYKDGTTSGTANGVYKMYALRLPSLEDVNGFPVVIDGTRADNDPARYFVGGVALQRPALTEVNGHIVAAFGSHCGRWNYTGYLLSVSKTPGVGVVSLFATESAPGAPSPQPLELATQKGGKAGIWQSGMGLPTLGNRVYFVTGNGQGHANGNVPASGRLPMSTLDECVSSVEIGSNGKISLVDYFQPYDYISLDAGDRDLGSSGLCVLDASVFKGIGANRIAVTAGKEGRTYVLNADNLGGFRQGQDGRDAVIQTIELGGSVFGGFGSYPNEGGYIYVTTVGGSTKAFRLGHDANGVPVFSLAGTSDFVSAGRVGGGQMTVTSDNGKPGTGIVWVSDVNSGLVAFRAVPQDGKLVRLSLPTVPGANKFQRPVFGDGRVFIQTTTNRLYCLGSPVAAALTCTGPVEFGDVALGSASTATVSCTANTAITAVNGCSVANPSFLCSNASLPSGPVAAGASFTFDVAWDLTDPTVSVVPGFLSSSLTISVGVSADYASSAVVSLEGNAVNEGPYLSTSPTEVTFGRLVLRGDTTDGLSATAVLQNAGNSTLTFTGFAWHGGDLVYTNLTASGELGNGFSLTSSPVVGSTLMPGQSISVRLGFHEKIPGPYSTQLAIWSDGGPTTLTLTASVNDPPAVTFEISSPTGGWTPLGSSPEFSFGDVTASESVQAQLRVCNTGGSALTITISKPPATAQLLATNPTHDLTEGQQIEANTVLAAPRQPNHPKESLSALWTITTGDASGLHNIVLGATVVTKQVGPLLADGTARYQWGRNLINQQCQDLCLGKGYKCWCGGPTIKHPNTYKADSLNLCTFDCSGDSLQACGGDGGHMTFLRSSSASSSSTATRSSSTVPNKGISSSSTTLTVLPVSSTMSSNAHLSSTTSSLSTILSMTSTAQSAPTSISTVSPLNPNQPDLVTGKWRYVGCFKDLVDSVRTLNAASTASDDMTLDKCAGFCSTGAWNGGAYNYFGLIYSRECFCGWTALDSLTVAEADCPNTCAGLPTGALGRCGGRQRLSVFANTVPNQAPDAPAHVAQAGGYSWLGCYTEATTGRALSGKSYASGALTVDSCAAFCAGEAWTLMGVEYGRECYCGKATNAGSVLAPTSECSMLCKGSQLQFCGAGGRLDLYTLAPLAAGPTISSALSVSSAPTSLSAGVSEIFPSSQVSSTASSMSAIISSPLGPESSSTGTTTTSLLTTSAYTSSGPFATATDGYFYIGCFRDTSSGHALPHLFSNNSVTPELAISYVNSRAVSPPSPTPQPSFLFLEYHHEVYGGSAFDFKGSAVTSLVGTKACRDHCYGSVRIVTTTGTDGGVSMSTTTGTANYCGGAGMFDLYALSTRAVEFPTTGGPVVTATAA